MVLRALTHVLMLDVAFYKRSLKTLYLTKCNIFISHIFRLLLF